MALYAANMKNRQKIDKISMKKLMPRQIAQEYIRTRDKDLAMRRCEAFDNPEAVKKMVRIYLQAYKLNNRNRKRR